MTVLSSIGWLLGDLEHLPHHTRPARVSRVDRGLLTVLTEEGERRVRQAAALYDGRLDPARFVAWRKLAAESRRQQLRVDARARALEHARARAWFRAVRNQPSRQRPGR